ncbi:MAG TPA: c-type cytochrome [Steroidobacteraceae bacterium]|nr:c-type cytochrome [Steroidobacteraceae bacterium]
MLALAGILALPGCDRERREFALPPPATSPPSQTALSPLVAGSRDPAFRDQQTHQYGENAYQLSQGQTLYSAFNCVGCHAHGGGDVGPALMDDKWIYGGDLDQVYLSIAQGRPNGMPAFAGLIPPQQIWQIAAYVRSLSGQGPKAARPSREDHLRTPPPQEARAAPPRGDARGDQP